MATLNITEFTNLAAHNLPAMNAVGSTSQSVTIGGTSVQCSALSPNVGVVRVVADADCYLAFGDSPTATTSDIFLPSGVVEYFGIASSSTLVAGITA